MSGLCLAALAAGCSHAPPPDAFTVVQELLAPRLEQRVEWRQDATADAAVEAAVAELLRGPLSADAAIQVALLASPRLQAVYEGLGVTQAELVQAGLLENPVFVGSAIRPDGDGSPAVLDLGIVQNFLNVLMRPARRRMAAAQFEQAQLRVGHEVLELATEVELAWVEAVAARQVAAMRRLVLATAESSAEMARRMRDAGNVSELALARERDQAEAARLEVAHSELALAAAREALTRAMGLDGEPPGFELPQALQPIPAGADALDGLEALALRHRLDLAAAGREVEILSAALGVSRNWRWIAVAEIGLDAERELDGQWLYGPEISIELPLFDRRGPAVARLAAELRASERRLAALALDLRSEVRLERERLRRARELAARYAEVVVPLRRRIVELSQEEYNYMLRGVFDLLLARRDEYDALEESIGAVRDYWTALARLDRAVGYALARARPGAPAGEAPPVPEPAADERQHSHGSPLP